MRSLTKIALIPLLALLALPALAQAQTGTPTHPPSLGEPIVIANAGFDAPESVIHDELDDVYLVSNMAPTFGFPNAIDAIAAAV